MIALASDHGGYALKETIKQHLTERNIPYKDFGCFSEASVDYPDMAKLACDAVVSGECEKALLFCGTGIGISMAANKIKGIRAACCSDYFSAKYTRLHNDANALCLVLPSNWWMSFWTLPLKADGMKTASPKSTPWKNKMGSKCFCSPPDGGICVCKKTVFSRFGGKP